MADLMLGVEVCVWWLCNTLATIYSKKSLQAASNSGALLLTLAQHSLTFAVFQTLRHFTQPKKGKCSLDWNEMRKWLPAGLFHAIGVWATNQSLTYMSTGQTQAIKCLEPLCLYLLSLYITPRDQSRSEMLSTIGSILVAITGTTIFILSSQNGKKSAYDHTVLELLPGIFFACISCIAFPLRNLWIKHKLTEIGTDTSPWSKMTLVSAWGIILTAPCMALQRLVWGTAFESAPVMDIAKSSLFHGMYHCTSVVILSQISPLLHSMLGVCKRIFVIISSSLYFGLSISLWEWIGLNFFLLGFVSHKATVSPTPQLKTTVRVLLGCLIAAMIYAFSFHKAQISDQQIVDASPALTKTDIPITLSWMYEQPMSNEHISTLSTLAKLGSDVHLICGSSACVRQAMEAVPEQSLIRVSQVDLREMFQGLPALEAWISKHPLHKVLAKASFEDHLAEAVRIAALWTVGGLFADIGYRFSSRQLSSLVTKTLPNMEQAAGADRSVVYIKSARSDKMLKIAEKFAQDYPNSEHGLYDALPTLSYSAEKYQLKSSPQWRYSALGYNVRVAQTSGIANLGDEVQSIVGLQYLPYVDCLVERDALIHNSCTEESSADASKQVISFFNAWWGSDTMEWPPPSQITPIFTSVYAPEVVVNRIWGRQMGYLKEHEPIGCRDKNTLKLMQEKEVDSYFSGCLTLMTQNPNPGQERNDQIYIVDVSQDFVDLLPEEVRSKAVQIEHDMKDPERAFSEEERFKEAFHYLSLYGNAKLLITSRIHAALPAVSFGTPVIFFNAKNMPGGGGSSHIPSSRIAGLTDLFHTLDLYHMKDDQELKERLDSFDWTNPPPNPNPGLLKRLRAAFWDRMREYEPIRDASLKFGLLPTQLHAPDFSKEALHFHFIKEDLSSPAFTAQQWQSIESVLYHHPNSHIIIHAGPEVEDLASLQESGYSVRIQSHSQLGPNFKDTLMLDQEGIFVDFDVLVLKPFYDMLESDTEASFTFVDPVSNMVKIKHQRDQGAPGNSIQMQSLLDLSENQASKDCEKVLSEVPLHALWVPPNSPKTCLSYLYHKYCILCNRVHSRLRND